MTRAGNFWKLGDDLSYFRQAGIGWIWLDMAGCRIPGGLLACLHGKMAQSRKDKRAKELPPTVDLIYFPTFCIFLQSNAIRAIR